MAAPFGSVSEAQDRVNELDAYAKDLGVKRINLDDEIASVQAMKAATLQWMASKRRASANGNGWPITVDDIRHCRTQRAVLREWALRNNGLARIADVAEFIMHTDLPKGEKDSVRSSLTNFVKASDLWEYHSPGVYRLLEAEHSAEEPGDSVSPADVPDPGAETTADEHLAVAVPNIRPAEISANCQS